MSSQNLISLQKVTFRFYDQEIFTGTTIDIRRGEHLAVIGGNASGKTAFGKALSGRYPVISGKMICSVPAERIAFVNFNSILSLRNAEIPYMQQRWNTFDTDYAPLVRDFFWPEKTIDQWTRDLLGEFNASHLLDRKNIHLSNGELRKIELIRALSTLPELIIIDNLFVGLDQPGRVILKEALDKVSATTTVILLSLSHEYLPSFVKHKLYCCDFLVSRVPPEPESHVVNGSLPADIITPEDQPSEMLVKLNDVNITYGKVKILKSVNWEIDQGQHWALIGPNGSGKSTLLSLLAADNPQSYSQAIFLFGKQRGTGESIWDIKRKIAFISPELHQFAPKQHSLKEVLIDDVAWNYPGIDRTGLPQKAGIWLRWLNLDLNLGRRFGTLSSGEQRMVLFVRILLYPFILLIADEPCQGLSEENIQKIRSVFSYLARHTKVSTIFVTHNPREIPETTHRIFDMQTEQQKSGKILFFREKKIVTFFNALKY